MAASFASEEMSAPTKPCVLAAMLPIQPSIMTLAITSLSLAGSCSVTVSFFLSFSTSTAQTFLIIFSSSWASDLFFFMSASLFSSFTLVNFFHNPKSFLQVILSLLQVVLSLFLSNSSSKSAFSGMFLVWILRMLRRAFLVWH